MPFSIPSVISVICRKIVQFPIYFDFVSYKLKHVTIFRIPSVNYSSLFSDRFSFYLKFSNLMFSYILIIISCNFPFSAPRENYDSTYVLSIYQVALKTCLRINASIWQHLLTLFRFFILFQFLFKTRKTTSRCPYFDLSLNIPYIHTATGSFVKVEVDYRDSCTQEPLDQIHNVFCFCFCFLSCVSFLTYF